MIALVDDLLGVPHVPGGRLPGPGTDCFGLVMECCRRAGRPIPDPFTSAESPMDVKGWIVERLEGWRPTDGPVVGGVVELLSADQPAHVGFIVDERQFLHSLRKIGAVLGRFDRDPWRQRIVGWYVYGG